MTSGVGVNNLLGAFQLATKRKQKTRGTRGSPLEVDPEAQSGISRA
jgi:hypothetical protein